MLDGCSIQCNGFKDVDSHQPEIDFSDLPTVVVPAQRHQGRREEIASVNGSVCMRLDLEDLKCFEVVERQFEKWGVIFSNAIAIQPSNPAFPPRSGNIVLLGSPKNGFLEATFLQPVHYISGYVTSSRRAVLAAYASDGQPIAHAELPEANLADSDSPIPPNAQLCLQAPNIHRVTFFTFDGHITLDDFTFSY